MAEYFSNDTKLPRLPHGIIRRTDIYTLATASLQVRLYSHHCFQKVAAG